MAAPQLPSALFLSEHMAELNEGARFLESIGAEEHAKLREEGRVVKLARGQLLFSQGEVHGGVWVIESGLLRTFYVSAQGREMTLAYWTSGHFVGGPEIFGRGRHVWSADAQAPSEVLFLPGTVLRRLAERVPQVALALIDGLVAKGKCYSALVQMLGTRSAAERLTLLLEIMAETYGRPTEEGILIDRVITQEQLATMLGTSRQWLSVSLEKLRSEGVITMSRHQIIFRNPTPSGRR